MSDVHTYLSRDPLPSISLLKYLQSHPQDTESFHLRGEEGEAVLVLLQVAASPYDRETYPGARLVCFIASDGPDLTRRLLAHVPRGVPIVFKLSRTADHAVVADSFTLTRTTCFHSFRLPSGCGWQTEPDLVRTVPTAAAWALFEQRGYERGWLLPLIDARQAFVVEAGEGAETQSVCFAFEHSPGIWEVGGLATHPAARRRGLAARIVRTAFAEFEARGHLGRYVVEESNAPSLALARTLGLAEFLRLTHYLSG